MAEQGKKPFLASCHACGHVWPAAWLPCPLQDMPRRIKCPYCGTREKETIFAASKASGDLARYAELLRCELARVEAEGVA